ncbi:hypothetical protein GN958_ATG00102, partial [Phytophthora infestans]
MDDLEDAVALVIALAGHAVSLAACVRQDDEPRQRHTASILHFDAIRHGAEYEHWFPAYRRCSRSSFFDITHFFLRLHGVLFAKAQSRNILLKRKGNRETTADMGMNKSYVIEIADAVARVLYRVANNTWCVVEQRFVERHAYDGRSEEYEGFYCRKGYPALNVQAIVSAANEVMNVEIHPGFRLDSKAWQHSTISQHTCSMVVSGDNFI